MKLDPLRSLQSKLSIAFLALAALALGSCGGGGAASSPQGAGSLQLLPGSGSFYAGVPYTLTITGGRKPYLVTSSEPTLVKLGFTTDSNEFSIVPNNPGVVDVGLDPNAVPSRTVIIQVRDSNGVAISNEYSVLQNFFTGYGESYTSTCAAGATGAPAACSGSETMVTLSPVSNGTLYGNRVLRFDRVRGDYAFVVEDPNAVPQLVNTITAQTDHVGRARVRLRVPNDAPTQMATYRVTDVATGVTVNLAFGIVQQAPIDLITFLPGAAWTFTGLLQTECGSGSADFFVYGGTPPYTVQANVPLSFSPGTLNAIGDRLTVFLPPSSTCYSNLGVVVTDSKGSRGLITISSQPGTQTLPALAVAPASIATLNCGTSGQATVVGGNGRYTANSSHPRITAQVAGNTVTVTRLAGDGTIAYPVTGSISITDGASVVTLAITATPANCP